MSIQVLNVLPDETTASRLEKELRDEIIRVALAPGAQLSEQEIAKRYGVSRQPVREALIALAKSRLVEIRPNRGTVVTSISLDMVREARFVREAVEAGLARQAANRFDPWVRDRLEINLKHQAEALDASDHNRFRELDGEFHILVAKGTGSTMAWQVVADMKAHMDRVCNLTLDYLHARKVLLEQHQAIADAIDAKDADVAEAAMRSHLREILEDLPTVRAAHPGLFA